MTRPPISCSIDLESPGKRVGFLRLAWSDVENAYGVIPVPIAVVRGGEGPTGLVTAGVHGDEYEGLLIARRLIAEIAPAEVAGRLIVMPGVNWPAVLARARTSPIDQQNMNRAFPGDAQDGPTAMIADFIERVLLPGVDVAIDLHSGGTKSIYSPCGYVYGMGAPAFRANKLAAAHAFGAPATVVVTATSSSGSLSSACERHGVPMVATELGGGARLDAGAFRIGRDGTRNLLRHAGVLRGAPVPTRTALLHTRSAESFVMAPIDGLFEPARGLGEDVAAGALAGMIWPMDDLERPPVEVPFAAAGRVLCVRTTPLVRRGDFLCHTGSPIGDVEFLDGLG
ncbi:MAG: succinylglutamate desuccinylase/aspartoacylase family protein [Methylobacteriaceae bacterium]|nr:succinylglutamate desuccinylase/aspartoacylase family protein [Methylobacteriaceae bacterium]